MSNRKLIESEIIGAETIGKILPHYGDLDNNVSKAIDKFYDKYSEDGVIDVQQATRKLTPPERREFREAVMPLFNELGIPLKDRYTAREIEELTRLQALKEQVDVEVDVVSEKEEGISRAGYAAIIATAYVMAGSFVVKDIKESTVNRILRQRLAGKNWSTRIWGNNRKLKRQIKNKIDEGIKKGWSIDRMESQVRERINVSKYESTRLVRTEANNIQTDATLQRLKDDGFTHYMFDATLDGRTSEICEELDGQIFRLEEAEEGQNKPSMHPNCRSDVQGVIVE